MPASNRTGEFKQILLEKQNDTPNTNRRAAPKTNSPKLVQAVSAKEYVSEAYVIVNNNAQCYSCRLSLTVAN
jgi:syntaxin 18